MDRDIRVQIIPGPFGVWRRLVESKFGISHWESISDSIGQYEHWFKIEESGIQYTEKPLSVNYVPVGNTGLVN